MGMDVLELACRIEETFDVTWPREATQRMWAMAAKGNGGGDITVGELCDFMRVMLEEWGKPIPGDCWFRVRAMLSEMFEVPAESIRRETYLRRDLGHD